MALLTSEKRCEENSVLYVYSQAKQALRRRVWDGKSLAALLGSLINSIEALAQTASAEESLREKAIHGAAQ